jgi:hypothetical protein
MVVRACRLLVTVGRPGLRQLSYFISIAWGTVRKGINRLD